VLLRLLLVSVALGLSGALAGCELVASFDRDKIPVPGVGVPRIPDDMDAGHFDGGWMPPPEDAGADAGLDAGSDAGLDAGVDGGPADGGVDAGSDAGSYAGSDAGAVDGGADAGASDAGADAGDAG
jgi:hypothetical protein